MKCHQDDRIASARWASIQLHVAFLAVAATLALPPHLASQSVDMQLREALTRTPIPGAIVRLLGTSGVVAQGLSGERGGIRLRASVAGSYRIRVDRIGQKGFSSEPFLLAAGAVRIWELLLESAPIELPELRVSGASQCGPGTAERTAAGVLWEEIGKALTGNLITQRNNLPLKIIQFNREVSLSGQALRQWNVKATLVRGRPFATLPSATLARVGFVEGSGDSVTYAAPDVELLLSEAFVLTHCFTFLPGSDGLAGLSFEPMPKRDVSDVRGTLWVDRATLELRSLEYFYTGLQSHPDPQSLLGGKLDFRRLATGAWLISNWHIRMPLYGADTARPTRGPRDSPLVGFFDQGARAEAALGSETVVDRAFIIGKIRDPANGRGLPDAIVSVVGYPDSALTDSTGRFALAIQAFGDKELSAAHPRLALLERPARQAILLSIGDTVQMEFAAPPLEKIIRNHCATARSRGSVVGMVVAQSGQPMPGVQVRARWMTGGGAREENDRTGADGIFALCNLPAGPSFSVWAEDRLGVVAKQTVQLEPREGRWLELRVISVIP